MTAKLFAAGAADRLIALGVQAEKAGELQEACLRYREAVAAAPGYAPAHLNLGIGLEACSDAAGAVLAYETALALDPNEAYACYNLAKLLFTRGELLRAEELLRRALQRKTDFPEAMVTLSRVLESRGDLAQALTLLEAALRARPGYEGALRNGGLLLTRMGNALVHLGKTGEAAEHYRRALSLQPDLAEAHCYLGSILVDCGLLDEAQVHLDKAVALQPGLAEAQAGLGNLHHALQRLEEAEAAYRRAIALDPGFVEAYTNLGHILAASGQAEAALASYDAALSLDPEYVEARWSRAMCRIPALRGAQEDLADSRCAFSEELASLEQWFDAGRSSAGYRAVGSQQPFWLAYQEEDNVDLLRRYGSLCARLMAAWQAQPAPPKPPRRDAGRIRVGIVSQHFREHSVWSALIRGWLGQIDAGRFEVSAFSLGAAEDAETRYARAHAARFVRTAGGLREWVVAIREARPDVLIYPEVGMDPMTAKLASLRLAPRQAASWGHPETTGLPTVDFYLSAQDLEAAAAQPHYTEQLLALPNLGCYLQRAPVVAAAVDLGQLGIDADLPLLLCPGAPFKYAPEHDALLPAIARELGRCQFVFFTHWTRALSARLRARLTGVFAREGLEAARYLKFVPWLSRPAFHGLMQRADVFLDSIGFSGFNTALQAVECGLPLVTRESHFLRGRLASGILRRLQMDELVAAGAGDYVALAVKLVGNRAYREDIRDRIAAQRQRLYEDRAPILALEEFLAQGA
jgi:predicted O-linked N-acetylglucosamine transferase (SPINDLY family)